MHNNDTDDNLEYTKDTDDDNEGQSKWFNDEGQSK